MAIRHLVSLTLVLTLSTFCACKQDASPAPAPAEAKKAAPAPAPAPAKTAPAKPAPAKTAPAKPADGKEITFDPRKPPAGYTNCHRNHCHKVGGGVASYTQVMAEMGATKIIGAPKPGPMPKAPADVAAPPADAVKTASGLATKVLRAGDGKDKPTAASVQPRRGWLSATSISQFCPPRTRGRRCRSPANGGLPTAPSPLGWCGGGARWGQKNCAGSL